MLEASDTNKSGGIEFDEFLVGCNLLLGSHTHTSTTTAPTPAPAPAGSDSAESQRINDLVRLFHTLDRDGDGRLTLDELSGLMSASGGHIDKDEARCV
jgi:Ca2+-binding EF-hand superfamily protein